MKNIFLAGAAACVLLSTAACQTNSSEGARLSAISPAAGKAMSCEDIAADIAAQDEIIEAAYGAQAADHAVNGGGSIALQGAMLSGAGSSVPFLGSALNVVGGAANMKAQAAERDAERAEKRRAQLVGLQQGKGCEI